MAMREEVEESHFYQIRDEEKRSSSEGMKSKISLLHMKLLETQILRCYQQGATSLNNLYKQSN